MKKIKIQECADGCCYNLNLTDEQMCLLNYLVREGIINDLDYEIIDPEKEEYELVQ